MESDTFFSGQDIIYYQSAIRQIKKSSEPLRPLFEAFSNAWESFDNSSMPNKHINITLEVHDDGLGKGNAYTFDKLIVQDDGVGFDEENFRRLKCLHDNTKGIKNKGAGRIQYIHFFDRVDFVSVFKEGETFFERMFTLSGSKSFLKNNSILYYKDIHKSDAAQTGTTLTFFSPITTKDNNFYDVLTLDDVKAKLLHNFAVLFCSARDNLPSINLSFVIDGQVKQKLAITPSDITLPTETFSILVPYKTKANGKVVEANENATINIRAFVMPQDDLKSNEIVLTAKGERVDSHIKLECLKDIDAINGKRYLFFLASDYFDEHVCTNRGQIELLTYDDFAKQDAQLFDSKVLLLDDICDRTNKEIAEHFPEIKERYNAFHATIKELQEMFLLDPAVIRKVRLCPSDDDKAILSKIYDYDKNIMAEKDAELKEQLDSLKNLIPGDEYYEAALSKVVDDFARLVPLQNRTSLTRYVARRQLILKEFELILQHGLNCQGKSSSVNGKNQRSADEKLLHNLIFPQKSSDTYNSALWILNEEFIYFNGVSESPLCDVKAANGEKIFRQEITAKEEEYLHEFGEHREKLRPDIMLFPEEHKAIIIELKAPDVPPYKYITQIQRYASLLMNYCEEKFSISTFYGYLIGEQIDFRDIRHVNPYFKDASRFGYIFCPDQPVVNDNNGTDGSLYMEVIKYSTLLERALLRNRIYREKLGTNFDKTK